MLTSSSSRPTRSSTTRPASEPVINAYETGPVAPGSHGYRQRTMEPLWSPAGAISGNRWQVGRPRKRRKQAKSVATGCHRLRATFHGKEGVDGSSPSEGSAKAPQNGVFCIRAGLHSPGSLGCGKRFGKSGPSAHTQPPPHDRVRRNSSARQPPPKDVEPGTGGRPRLLAERLGRRRARRDGTCLLGNTGDPAFDRPCDFGPFLGRHHQVGPAGEFEVVGLCRRLLVLLELLLRDRGGDCVVLVGADDQ